MLLMLVLCLTAAWLVAVAVVVAVCISAARADRAMVRRPALQAVSTARLSEVYTLPRRATWRTVRSSSLRSAHSDQLAT